MDAVLRPARPEDKSAVAAFTQGTFAWGDYLERVFEGWLAAPNSLTLVAEAAGTVTGVARGSLLSPVEAWSQGLR
ncbi:MAG: GNAT family N-acetyltransferase, partial [Actinobacteria bacterium]|nr:GNAT family N-acetyltransferase [Actinomycetota bacterium]